MEVRLLASETGSVGCLPYKGQVGWRGLGRKRRSHSIPISPYGSGHWKRIGRGCTRCTACRRALGIRWPACPWNRTGRGLGSGQRRRRSRSCPRAVSA